MEQQRPFHAQAYLRARTSLLLATRTSCKHRFKEISRHIFRKFNGWRRRFPHDASIASAAAVSNKPHVDKICYRPFHLSKGNPLALHSERRLLRPCWYQRHVAKRSDGPYERGIRSRTKFLSPPSRSIPTTADRCKRKSPSPSGRSCAWSAARPGRGSDSEELSRALHEIHYAFVKTHFKEGDARLIEHKLRRAMVAPNEWSPSRCDLARSGSLGVDDPMRSEAASPFGVLFFTSKLTVVLCSPLPLGYLPFGLD